MNAPLRNLATGIPPLENGDCLTRAKFERRYDAMPGLKKAELIEGVVYMPSPVSLEGQGEPHFNLITLFGVYRALTPGVRGADNASVRLDLDNEPQPDVVLFITPECGGAVKIDPDDIINGAPELAAEVASSSVSLDLGKKFHVYRRNGIREYVVWRVKDAAVDWFVLTDGAYEPLPPAADGVYQSGVFPGLWLDAPALLRGDLAAVHATLQRGLQSPEHQAFVDALARRRTPPQSAG